MTDHPEEPGRFARRGGGARRRVVAVFATILVGGAFGVGIAYAWQAHGGTAKPQPAAAAVRDGAAPPVVPAQANGTTANDASAAPGGQTPFQLHARQAGAEACAGLYDALGNSLTEGSRFSLRSNWDREQPNARPIEGLVALTYETQGYSGLAAGYVVAAPEGASRCGGAMVRVASFDTPCDTIGNELPAGATPVEGVAPLRVYAQPRGGTIFLLPVNSGCAVVSALSGTGGALPEAVQ